MKLLFDHNLSPRLVNRLAELFPESTHVYLLGMDQVDDREIWNHAKNNDFTIVTRDSDYCLGNYRECIRAALIPQPLLPREKGSRIEVLLPREKGSRIEVPLPRERDLG